MTSDFDLFELTEQDLGNYGYARARDLAFDAVRNLWDLRQAQGMKQADLASKVGRDPGWVSRNLRGPGNWTLRTLGEFVVGLNGRLQITVVAEESAPDCRTNFHAYHEYAPANRVPTYWSSMAPESKATDFWNEYITIQNKELPLMNIEQSIFEISRQAFANAKLADPMGCTTQEAIDAATIATIKRCVEIINHESRMFNPAGKHAAKRIEYGLTTLCEVRT